MVPNVIKINTSDNYKNVLKELGNNVVKKVFNKYKTFQIIANQLIIQNVTIQYDKLVVQGGKINKNFVEEQLINKLDAERYIKEINDCLEKLPYMSKEILKKYYIQGKRDILIYIDLGLPRSTYFYMKKEAVKMFVDELLTRSINI